MLIQLSYDPSVDLAISWKIAWVLCYLLIPYPVWAQADPAVPLPNFEYGVSLYEKGDYTQSTVIFDQLIAQAKLKKNPKVLGRLYYQLGKFYESQGACHRSLDFLLSSTELLEPNFVATRSNIIAPPLDESPTTYNLSIPEDAEVICDVYNKVGSLYFRQGNYGKARRYWRKSYHVAQQYKNPKALSTAYNNLGELQRIRGSLDTAILYHQYALTIKTHIKDSLGMHTNWSNLGSIYLQRLQFDLALDCYQQAYQLATALSNPIATTTSSLDFSNFYLEKNEPKAALSWAYKGLNLSIQLQDIYKRAQAHEQLALIYGQQRQLDSLLLHQKQWILLRNAINQADREKLTMQTEAEYLVYEKEKKLLQVRQEASIQQAQNRTLDLIQWGGLLLLGLLLLIAILVLRWRKRHNDALERHVAQIEQQSEEKGILLKEIHHRVKNNLQVITSLLGLQSLSIEDPIAKDLFQQSQQRINSMSMIHQMLYQSDHLTDINYRDYLERLVYSLVSSVKGHDFDLQINMNVPDLSLNVDTAIPLGLLINEIVTNALKYGLNKGADSVLTLELHPQTDQTFHLHIGDNGDGIPGDWTKASNPSSLGLRLIQQLSRQLQGSIQRDMDQVGTHYVLHFKEIVPTT